MTERDTQTARRAEYEHPPLIEVVFGVSFEPYRQWMIPHVGAFWTRHAEKFPKCEHAPLMVGTIVDDPATGLPIPRVWLINDNDDRLIQLQAGRFLFNWRAREKGGAYPRYEELSKSFFDLFRDFQAFCTENGFGDFAVREYELTYINHIPEPNEWTFPADAAKVIDGLNWREQSDDFLPTPTRVNWNATFTLPDDHGNLTTKFSQAKRLSDDKELLVLELAARGIPTSEPLDYVNWFSLAHEWIVRGFEDITTERAQEELWGKHD